MSRYLFGWWQVAEDALRPLTMPATDVAASDRCVADLLRGSAIVKGAQQLRERVYGAWLDSRTRTIVGAWQHLVLPADSGSSAAAGAPVAPAARVAAAIVTVVAVLTAFGLEWLAGVAR